MVDYTIAAIPTMYEGRQYRSRLEARWAAFFDLLGIQHEYEPVDLGKWSPDFLLPDYNMMVEVKPITEFDSDTWLKMTNGCHDTGWNGHIMLTRVAPKLVEDFACVPGWIGILSDDPWTATEASLVHITRQDIPRFFPDFVIIHTATWWSASGNGGELEDTSRLRFYGKYNMQRWAEASNAVQWDGPK